MKKKKKRWFRSLLCMAVVCMLGLLGGTSARAGTLYESPYVVFSPDGFAWTVKENLLYSYYLEYFYKKNITPEYWYPNGERIETGMASALRELELGEHYYAYKRMGEVPIKYWEVKHSHGGCIHDACKVSAWHGVPNVGVEGNGTPCKKGYYSGWFAYCADCGGQLTQALVYMSRTAAASITSINMNHGYYYSCPSCAHIENTVGPLPHECQAISFNRYRIVYDKNDAGTGTVSGLMEPSLHMYNNEDVYEGERITPITRLSKNVYKRRGYVFKGWNTSPDGSGTHYEDCAEILNLSVYDYEDDPERGTVTLYAQWETSESTLRIDPDGGTYEGNVGVTALVRPYDETYHADPAKVQPPLGYKVSFQTNGGSYEADRRAVTVFTGWKLREPLHGKFRDNVYAFLGEDGSVDTLTAIYAPGSILLPTPTRSGYSFGGWFEDVGCTKPVGFGGDSYTPKADTILYAKWVELVLYSEENYEDNDRLGAVDLSWSQPDDLPKSYKLYESGDGVSFSLIYGAKETTNREETERDFAFKGVQEVYTVPYSGFYEISAAGAQGGDYGSFIGGWGGKTTAKMYFTAGEQLTVTVGGKNRYNGGGKGSVYGNGGGATTVVSNLRGTLMVAGGGGGASETGHGGRGGAENSLRADGSSVGASGHAGGGGGYVGGNAGEYIVHTHTEECIVEHDLSYSFQQFSGITSASMNGVQGNISNTVHLAAHTDNTGTTDIAEIWIGDSTHLIDTKGNRKLSIPLYFYSWGDLGYIMDNGYMAVYDQSGNSLSVIDMSKQYTDEWRQNQSDHYRIDRLSNPYEIELPEGTTGVYVLLWLPVYSTTIGAHVTVDINPLFFSDGVEYEYICGMQEGDVESAKPAYGGSSYIDNAYATYFQSEPGVQSGNGEACIKAVAVGYMNTLSLNGVAAPDLAAPDRISTEEKDLILKADGDKAVKVTFMKPKDNGTQYWYKAESYQDGTDVLLCTSNVTTETLTTGTACYLYIFDSTPERIVTAENADNRGTPLRCSGETETVRVILPETENVMYLHVAAVDVAGNVGPTADIKVKKEDIPWSLGTNQVAVTDSINGTVYDTVYQKDVNTFYVRADGKTPFMLSYQSYLYGEAREDYQIDYQIFDVATGEKHQRYSTKIPYSVPLRSEVLLPVSRFTREMSGDSVLRDAMNTAAFRKRSAKDNYFYQAFTVPKSYHGQTLVVTPIAGATFGEEILYSEWSEDVTHAAYLIADGEAPVINGAEVFENKQWLNQTDEGIELHVTAVDTLSGIGDFTLEIVNEDNHGRKTYYPGADGSICVELSKTDTLFRGDICVTVYAVDRVGNETKVAYEVTEFALDTEIKRILTPNEPVFKGGESGILSITVWGYADRVEVEFPEEFTSRNPELNRTYNYMDVQQHKREEQLQFMVPLGVPQNEQYRVTVRAFKGDRLIEEYPSLSTVSGGESVLDELRTRLR